jgi:hypothetical protein
MLIGLTGRKGCGKSSIARILRDNHGFKIKSFASPIKRMLEGMGIEREKLEDPCLKEIKLPDFGKSPRELMQSLGTEWARDLIHPNIWIYLMEKELGEDKNVVIDDVRFHNEAQMIRGYDGIVIEVLRGKHLIEDGHISEAGVGDDMIDNKLQNISCYVTDLELEVTKILEGVNETVLAS